MNVRSSRRFLDPLRAAPLLAVLLGCHPEAPKGRTAADAPTGTAVAVETAVVVRVVGGQAAAPGTVRAGHRAALAARISAAVVEVPHREGERVTAGAILVRLDDAALRAALTAAEAALQAAEADQRRAEALLAKGAATPRERDEAGARAAGARAGREAARDNLAYAVLRAPFAGRVGTRPVDVGQVVSPGTTLVEVEGDGGFEVEATVEADVVGALRPGFATAATVDGVTDPVPAVVRSVSPAGDPTTHRFEVRADLASAPGLRSGLFARLWVPAPRAAARLLVPAAAVFERGGLAGVFVVSEGRAHLRWIATGARTTGQVEVRAGLEADEHVVVGPSNLEDGVPVVEAR
jgi:RND family efflux transporter MFP subunit